MRKSKPPGAHGPSARQLIVSGIIVLMLPTVVIALLARFAPMGTPPHLAAAAAATAEAASAATEAAAASATAAALAASTPAR
jgi:hypothetical protein